MDPYKVLGVSPSATDDEVKKAYKALSKKYHPDANINNPNRVQAEERFKDVQQAYQIIMKQRTSGNSYGGYDSYGNAGSQSQSQGTYSGGGYSGGTGDPFGGFWNMFGGQGGTNGGFQPYYNETDSYLSAVVGYMRNGYYKEARNVLDNMTGYKDARWYFYSAQVHNGLGNQMEALDHAKMAVSMEPDNRNYDMLLHMIQQGGNWYESRSRQYGTPNYGGGSFCLKLCIANILCNICCSGGGFCCGSPGGYGTGPVA